MNTKHIRFSEEYLIDLNATQAAIRSGYSQNRAGEIGYQLLQRKDIQDYIAELRLQQQEKAKIKVEDIVKQYLALGMYDIKDYYEDVYIMDYVSSEDLKGIRCKKKYGRELYPEDFDDLPVRYKKYYQPYSRLKRFDRMTKEQRVAIQGIKYDKSGNKILQLSNKQAAIDSLAKHLGMFIDKQQVEHTGQIVKRIIKVNPTGDK